MANETNTVIFQIGGAMTEEQLSEHERRKRLIAINDEWSAWRKEAMKKLDEIKTRINALECRTYPGCGFHYALVEDYWQIGLMIASRHSIKESELEIPIIAQVRLESMIETIKAAEDYLASK